MVYRAYRPDRGWYIVEILKLAGVCILITYLFYNNAFYLPFSLVVCPALWRKDRQNFEQRQRNRIKNEFKDIIVMLSGNLNVGYSLENAFVRTQEDIYRMYGEMSILLSELKCISNGLACNRRLEDMLLELGKKCGIREITECGELLITAKQYGGNMILIIRKIAGNISEQLAVELEIGTAISEKRLEGQIMLIMPFIIVFYLRIVNTAYVSALYQTIAGRIIMTVSLGLVILAAMINNKIISNLKVE